MEPVSTISHCSWLRKCVFMVQSSTNGQNVDWSSWETVFQVLRNLVEPCGVSFEDGRVLRWSQSAPLATAVGSESVYSWSDPLKRPEYWVAFMWELPFIKDQFSRFGRVVYSWQCCHRLSCKPFIWRHFWCHHCIPCPWKCGFLYTICHNYNISEKRY